MWWTVNRDEDLDAGLVYIDSIEHTHLNRSDHDHTHKKLVPKHKVTAKNNFMLQMNITELL